MSESVLSDVYVGVAVATSFFNVAFSFKFKCVKRVKEVMVDYGIDFNVLFCKMMCVMLFNLLI